MNSSILKHCQSLRREPLSGLFSPTAQIEAPAAQSQARVWRAVPKCVIGIYKKKVMALTVKVNVFEVVFSMKTVRHSSPSLVHPRRRTQPASDPPPYILLTHLFLPYTPHPLESIFRSTAQVRFKKALLPAVRHNRSADRCRPDLAGIGCAFGAPFDRGGS